MKYPHIKQHDEKDCGAACLCMISEYYGLKISVAKARTLIKVDNNGANIYGLVDGAKQIGLTGDGLSGTFEELNEGISSGEVKYPFVARIINEFGYEHYVVVWKRKKQSYVIGDPGHPRKKAISIDAFASSWLGQIITFEKNNTFHVGNEKKGSFSKFFKYLIKQKKLVVYVCLLSLIMSIINVTGSFVFNYVVKESQHTVISKEIEDERNGQKLGYMVISSADEKDHSFEDIPSANTDQTFDGKIDSLLSQIMPSLKTVCITAILLYILKMILDIIRGRAMAKMSKYVEFPLTMEFYDHLIDLPAGFYGTRNTGEYMSRFKDTAYIKSAISNAALTIILDSMMAIACGLFLCWLSPELFFITCFTIVVYIIILFAFRKPLSDINYKLMESDSNVTSYLKETIDGIETIKSYNYMFPVKKKVRELYNEQLDHGVNGNILGTILGALMTMVSSISMVILLWTGANLCIKGQLMLSDLLVFYYMMGYFLQPVGNLVNLQPTIQTAMVAAERLNDILDAEKENNNKQSPNDLKGDIVFDKVVYGYGNREPVLNELSLTCKAGTKTALVGESGSGKTTIAKLLMAFDEVRTGKVTIGKIQINDYSPIELRKHISYISQTTSLFADTIMNNIKIGNPNASNEDVVDICKKCGIDSFAEKLPMGYNTKIEENGKNLSGGQRQRLAIARALIRKPDILIMDEATSNLDTISEKMIRDIIDSLPNDITVLIIAHRLKTIMNCDNIYVVKDGSVVEEGKHDQLLAQNGYYAQIWG
ncbi:MAG: peptidase domain-containing ABC transporter [Ruminococcus sp.]|uniref:peptidase domain-containing ABC transporter n=1 Tax=Ruminococcus sp. TaxID=41978 RepID=UPI0025D4EC8D|nr:peptidase domain-containing ABC transporter [Ruminococcus sp.]MBO4867421.1 peptidase domain-containing ABC transporter [Ruminococcus sp.]